MNPGTSGGPPVQLPIDGSVLARKGYFLPHWEMLGATYHVVFCLRDSLPRKVVEDFIRERDELLKNPNVTEAERKRVEYLVSNRIAQYLDAGVGTCILKNPEIAALTQSALQHFHGERYQLHAWCIMPNHVHAVVEPIDGNRLPKILHSWKSFSAHAINKALASSGEVWHKESYDHIIRSEKSLERTINYVLNNPATAGIQNWEWVGCQPAGEIGETPKVQ